MNFSMGFDPGSLAAITKMLGFEALLTPEIAGALTEAGNITVSTAQQISDSLFQHPTGAFADSLYFWIVSPEEVAIASDKPYARRLEEGFSNMSDSLGRYYPYWPAYHWAQQTVDAVQPEVEALVAGAVEEAFGAIGGAE